MAERWEEEHPQWHLQLLEEPLQLAVLAAAVVSSGQQQTAEKWAYRCSAK